MKVFTLVAILSKCDPEADVVMFDENEEGTLEIAQVDTAGDTDVDDVSEDTVVIFPED